MKKDKEKIFQLSYLVFLNNIRGLNIIKLFSKKKMNFEAVITTKNLNKKILQDLKKLKVRHIIIKNCKNLKENLKKKYDVFVVAGFPHIFNQETLNLPKFGSINLHAGPLPKYRGGSPLNWQIINNEKKIGISIIKNCICFVTTYNVQMTIGVYRASGFVCIRIRYTRRLCHPLMIY